MPDGFGRFIVGIKGNRGGRAKDGFGEKKNKCSEKAFTTNICFDIIILSGCDFIKNSCGYI